PRRGRLRRLRPRHRGGTGNRLPRVRRGRDLQPADLGRPRRRDARHGRQPVPGPHRRLLNGYGCGAGPWRRPHTFPRGSGQTTIRSRFGAAAEGLANTIVLPLPGLRLTVTVFDPTACPEVAGNETVCALPLTVMTAVIADPGLW